MLRYIKPSWLVLATCLAAALYVCLFVRETVLPSQSAELFTFQHYKAVWHLVSTGGRTSDKEGGFHRSKLWLYLLSFFFVSMIHAGCSLLYVLYELSSPLCWGPTLIGYGAGALNVASLTSLLGLKILQSCLSDFWVALVGLVSTITGLLVFSVADTTALMFTGKTGDSWLYPDVRLNCGLDQQISRDLIIQDGKRKSKGWWNSQKGEHIFGRERKDNKIT